MRQRPRVKAEPGTWGVGDVMFISSQLRGIIAISRDISLAATNAALLANRSETRAVGFEVVSRGLRDFSSKINVLVRDLAEETQRIVREVAVLSESSNFRHFLYQVDSNTAVLKEAIRRRESLESDTHVRIMEGFSRLMILTSKAEKLCAMGDMLARLGLIEAVDGGTMRAGLQTVSNKVAENIAQILAMVRVMQSRLTS